MMKITRPISFLALFIFVAFLTDHGTFAQDFCYADNLNPYLYFTTKTSYNHVKNLNTNPISIPGCTPAMMWLFSRHGTIYPKNDNNNPDMQDMIDQMPVYQAQVIANHRAGRGQLCQADLDNIGTWTINYNLADEEKLAPAGQDEFLNLGDRYRTRLPNLINRPYNSNEHKFRFTTASRTEKSCNWFNRGIWGATVESGIKYDKPIDPDPLVRFYDACTKWIDEVDENPASLAERNEFRNSPEVAAMIRNVNTRLGYTSANQLSRKNVETIYNMCRYDKTLNYNATSAWCASFSYSDLLVLEYLNDLESYYQDGYGYNINVEQACNPVVDLYNYFNAIVTGQTTLPLGVFYFSHHGAISKLAARFGLFKDVVSPKANNYETIGLNRVWRSGEFVNHAANMVFVLHKCSNDFAVQLFINEHLVRIPTCSSDNCPFTEFSRIVKPIVDTCDFDAICENP